MRVPLLLVLTILWCPACGGDDVDAAVDAGVDAGAEIDAPLELAGLGTTCTAADTCASGFCVDDVCCDAACDGGCGTCDPAGACTPDPESVECGAFVCTGDELDCPTTCATHADCVDGAICVGATCVLGETILPWPTGFDGQVRSILHVGHAWYVGGAFQRVSSTLVEGLVAMDASGNQVNCDLGSAFNAPVYALLAVGSSLYVGGAFSTYQGASANRIAKIDAATCALDTTFSPPATNGFDAAVYALATSGTALYVGGEFRNYRGLGADSASRLAKVDLISGVLDQTFSPIGTGNNGFDAEVRSLLFVGGLLYAGGGFSAYKGITNSARRLAKLNPTTGAIDTTFSPAGATTNGFDSVVHTLTTVGASLYVGGMFTAYKGIANSARRLAKLHLLTGAIDTTFSPAGATSNGFDGAVRALKVDGTSLYVSGQFSAYRGVTDSAAALAKLDLTSGAIDTAFSPVGSGLNGFDDEANALSVIGGSLYVGGLFTRYQGVAQSAPGLAKLDLATGAIDAAFRAEGQSAGGVAGGNVYALATDGTTLWAGGNFNIFGGQWVNGLVKFDDVTHAIDTTFSPPASNGFSAGTSGTWAVAALATAGTSLYVGGDFTAYRGVPNSARRLAKLDLLTGEIDTTFSPVGATSNGLDSYVNALAIAGNSLYVGGYFSQYRGVGNSANALAKLDLTTGAIDTTFSPPGTATSNGFTTAVKALAISGTSLYVGGGFTSYRADGASSANYLVKLDLTSGVRDAGFSPIGATSNGFDNAVYALAVSADSLFAGGFFTAYKGVANSARRIAKLDLASGAIDTTFSPIGATANGFDGDVQALHAVGTAVYAGGGFQAYRGVASSSLAFAKLDQTTGAIDGTFSPVGPNANGFDNYVFAMNTATVNGEAILLAGGDFGKYRSTPRRRIAAVDAATGTLE